MADPEDSNEPVFLLPGASEEQRWTGLMVKAQNGDQVAYDTLLREISLPIKRYCSRFVGGLNLSEDCLQESLIAIHRARQTYDPERSFRAWMYTIVRHKVIDSLRSYRFRSRKEVSGSDAVDVASEENQEALVRSDLLRLLSKLAPKYRDALTLTKLDGFPVTEAAKKLGISEAALKVRVHRGIGKLQKVIEKELSTF